MTGFLKNGFRKARKLKGKASKRLVSGCLPTKAAFRAVNSAGLGDEVGTGSSFPIDSHEVVQRRGCG